MQVTPSRPRRLRRSGRGTQIASGLLLAAVLVLGSHRIAGAIQASGSIALVPSKQFALMRGESFEVAVYVRNSSTDASGNPISARLSGPIRLSSIVDPSSEERATSFEFASGPAMGCVVKAAGVRRCAAGRAGEFEIDLDPAGFPLSAAEHPVFVASITLFLNASISRVGLRASIPSCGLEVCESESPRMNCAASGATGDTIVTGGDVLPATRECLRRCKGAIDLRSTSLDRLSIKGEVEVSSPSFDPSTAPFQAVLQRSTGAPLAEIFVPAGEIERSGASFSYVGPGSSSSPGVQLIRLTPRGSGRVLLEMEYYGSLDAAESYMPLEITFSGSFSTFFEYWKPRPGGRGWVIRKAP